MIIIVKIEIALENIKIYKEEKLKTLYNNIYIYIHFRNFTPFLLQFTHLNIIFVILTIIYICLFVVFFLLKI